MDTRRLLFFEPTDLAKMNLVHSFVCRVGLDIREPEVVEYVTHLPAIEKKLPGDILHKVMFI